MLDRHRDLRIVVSHGGGYLPAFSARMDHGWRERSDVRGCAELPSSYLRRLWFDSLVHSPESLQVLLAAVGADRVVLGSDYPFDMGVADPLAKLVEAGVSGDDLTAIQDRTAATLGLIPTRCHGSIKG